MLVGSNACCPGAPEAAGMARVRVAGGYGKERLMEIRARRVMMSKIIDRSATIEPKAEGLRLLQARFSRVFCQNSGELVAIRLALTRAIKCVEAVGSNQAPPTSI